MHRRGRLFFAAVVMTALISFSGCDWAQFRNGPDRAGYSTTQVAEFAGIPGLIEKWTGTTGGAVRSSPASQALPTINTLPFGRSVPECQTLGTVMPPVGAKRPVAGS